MGDKLRIRLVKADPAAQRAANGGGIVTILPPTDIAAASRLTPVDTPAINSVWMGPGQPPNTVANPAIDPAHARQFDYPVNYNTRFQPKSGEGVTFQLLRQLADSYDLLRVVIERRKDQVEALEWKIMPKDETPGKAKDLTDQIAQVTDWFQRPSVEYTWNEWLRVILEDMFVCDAIVLAPRFTYGKKLYSLDPIDPATVKRVIDERGMTPMPPNPAYQQMIKGVPATDFTVEDLYYWMRNPRSWRVYGFSPVEWIIVTVNIALRRQMFTLGYFTEGNLPEALASVPDNWTTQQIKEFQTYWDDLMTGNLGRRRTIRWIPTDANKVKELKAVDLKNEFEEWLARLVCFAFSISPSALIKELNRSTAQTNQNTAVAEGLMPLLNSLRGKFTYLIQNVMGFKDLKFAWDLSDSIDPNMQSQIDQVYLTTGVVTPDEVRASSLGLEPMADEDRTKFFPPTPPGQLETMDHQHDLGQQAADAQHQRNQEAADNQAKRDASAPKPAPPKASKVRKAATIGMY